MSEIQPPRDENSANPPVIGYARPATSMPPTFAMVWCRILAVWMFAWGLYSGATFVGLSVAFLFTSQSSLQEIGALLSDGFPAVVWLLMAWYCWSKAPAIALRMIEHPDDAWNQSTRGMNPDELLHILLMGIGIYLLTTGLPSLVEAAYTKFASIHGGQQYILVNTLGLCRAIVRCFLGLWLILGTRGVVIFLRRHGGKWRDESETQP